MKTTHNPMTSLRVAVSRPMPGKTTKIFPGKMPTNDVRREELGTSSLGPQDMQCATWCCVADPKV